MAAALTDEYPEHAGARWRLRDSAIGPRPVQSPRPPIWVGGSTEAALRRAAARGDGWLPQGTPRMGLEAAIRYIRAHRQKTRDGAPIEIGANSERLYVGTPGFDLGADARAGSGEELAAVEHGHGHRGADALDDDAACLLEARVEAGVGGDDALLAGDDLLEERLRDRDLLEAATTSTESSRP